MKATAMPDFQTEIAVAVISACGILVSGLGVTWLRHWLQERSERRESDAVRTGMSNQFEVDQVLKEMRAVSSAERVILFVGHNCGGLPRPTTPFFVSARQWDVSDAHADKAGVIRDYINLTVDPAYIGMLLESERDGYVVNVVDQLPACQLRRYYEAEGVSHSLILFIAIKAKQFIYVSVAKYSDEPFTDHEITTLQLKAQRIKGLL